MNVDFVIKYLKNSNKYLEESLIEGFVNETTVKYFPLYVFETFGINAEAQQIIMELSEDNIKILAKIISYAENKKQDWIPLCASFYHFLKNDRYANLVKDINDNGIDDSLIEKLLFVCCNSGNYLKINSLDDLRRLDSIREEVNKNNNTYDPNIILLNKYGISYDSAYNLYKTYAKDVLQLPDSNEKSFLLDIKNIIEGKGTNKEVFKDKNFVINIDSILRNYFTNIYNKRFYKIDKSKYIGQIEGVDLYDAGVDFNMCIYSFGLATDLPTPSNFKEAWNRPSIQTDYMCNSIISSANIKTVVKHTVFGFDNIGNNEMALLGSNDLGTGGLYNKLNVTNPYHTKKLIADVEFRVPNQLINNTRFTNNEVYRTRRRINEGRLERINPNYIVYFKTEENFKNDSIWQESLKAAKDFGIPIVIVDCEKCLIHNIEKIEKNMEIFEKRYDDSKVLSRIIEDIYTLNNGYRNIAKNLLDKYFNLEIIFSYLNRILQHIDEISVSAPRTALECIKTVIDSIDDEFAKVLKSPYWVEKAREDGANVEKPQDVINVFFKKKKEIEALNIDYELDQMKID